MGLLDHHGPTEYYWSDTVETHKYRNREMVKAHSEIKKLYGPDIWIAILFTPWIILQLYLAYRAADMGWLTFFIIAYFIGGTITHSCFLAIHEVTHNLCFKNRKMNDLFAIFLNLCVPAPYAMMFKKYHAEHHRYLGWDGVDADIPTSIERKFLSNYIGKIFFVTFQVCFYAGRPPLIRRIPFEYMIAVNYAVQITFDLIVYYFFGWWPLIYLATSVFLGCGWHPLAGHFISEHFVFKGNGEQETFSYYGPLNILMWNAGYHVEHHDFPNIPWTRIAQLNTIAPEFYVDLLRTESWPGTLIDFVLDKKVGLSSRVLREKDAGKREKLLPTHTEQMKTALPHEGPCEWRL